MRDDFRSDIKQVIAARVSYRCSNPQCRRPTSGPHTDVSKYVNIGVAAHITAASSGGPRYDPFQSKEERSAADNGIWLCQACAKLIDNDEQIYTIPLLNQWRRDAEREAEQHLAQYQHFLQSQKYVLDNDLWGIMGEYMLHTTTRLFEAELRRFTARYHWLSNTIVCRGFVEDITDALGGESSPENGYMVQMSTFDPSPGAIIYGPCFYTSRIAPAKITLFVKDVTEDTSDFVSSFLGRCKVLWG